MQIVQVTQSAIFSTAFTLPMLRELATKACGMTPEQVFAAEAGKLAKASGSNRAKSQGMDTLEFAKLRTIIAKKLGDGNDYGTLADGFEFEFDCLETIVTPEPDINAAGANKARQRTAKGMAPAELRGGYTVVRCGLKATADTDAGKHNVWQHVWTCTSFEEYFAKAPAKETTRTGRIITAASEIKWALKSGWIKPVAPQ